MRPSAHVLAAFLAAPLPASPADTSVAPFRDPALPVEERITDLISRMTVDEKVDCLATRAAVPRLGVRRRCR